MKILLITPTSSTVINFRLQLIDYLKKQDNEVEVLTFDDERKEEVLQKNIKFFCIKDDHRNLNPLKILTLKKKISKVVSEIQPDIVMTFMLKPNIFGVLGAKKAGVKNIFSMVEGAGDVFTNNTFKWKIIRKIVCILYKKAFKKSKKVFFLNNDDKNEFIQRKLVKENQCEVIHGIGVDLKHFAYKPIINHDRFLMIARMLKTKGVIEYCKCARIVKQKYPNAQFDYLGSEGTIKLKDIQEYIDDGSINYLGTTNDVRPYLENVLLLLLLSSYREGLPMSILEAESVGRAIITSNNIGCRDTVINGYNGFLIENSNYTAMADNVIWCIEHQLQAEEMGKNARKFAEENFDSLKINKKIYEVIKENFACFKHV